MIRHSPIVAVVALVGVGLLAVALIPGERSAPAHAGSTQVALAAGSSPNPDLLKRLDAEVAPPPVVAPSKLNTPEPTDSASVQPVSLNTGAALATPTTSAAPPANAAPAVALKTGTVGSSAVNLRAGPSSSAQQISVLQPGEAVKTGQTIGGWVQVTRADGSTGWVYSSYLAGGGTQASGTTPKASPTQVATAQPRAMMSAQPHAVITGDTSNLEDKTARIASRLPAYDRPGASAQTIFAFQPGDQVRIAEVRGDWLRVETDDGISAWIRR